MSHAALEEYSAVEILGDCVSKGTEVRAPYELEDSGGWLRKCTHLMTPSTNIIKLPCF